MIDNAERYQKFSSYWKSIHQYQRKLFILLESGRVDRLAKKIVREIEHKKTKKCLRVPFIQGLFLKYIFCFSVKVERKLGKKLKKRIVKISLLWYYYIAYVLWRDSSVG